MGTTVTPLRLTIIGAGYLGLTHAVCMADLGHEVLALDVDEQKITRAGAGETPFFEPGLEPLLRKNLDAGRLRFTTSFAEAGEFGEVHFLCVGTPQAAGGAAALSYLNAAAGALAPYLATPCLIVGKSTVPVGTARALLDQIRTAAPAGTGVGLAWNPEFLREGYAIQDSLAPDRFVFGVTADAAAGLLRRIYAKPLAAGIPALVMDLETAELVKVSANAFLATKISFINVMAEACEAAGADVVQLAEALGHDERIGPRFLKPGLGFGGGCLPKDIRAFRATAADLGVTSLASLLGTVDTINFGRRTRVTTMTREAVGGSLAGKRIAVLGAAFKPESDDVRDSPALNVAGQLQLNGAAVNVYDPKALENAQRLFPTLSYAVSVEEACDRADAVLVLTEWPEFVDLDPDLLADRVRARVVVDGRNCLDVQRWQQAGWRVHCLGRRVA